MAKKSSKREKRHRDFASDRWRCQQLWLSKYGDHHRTTATIQKHIRLRNYLNISQDVVIDYEYFTDDNTANKKKKATAVVTVLDKAPTHNAQTNLSLLLLCQPCDLLEPSSPPSGLLATNEQVAPTPLASSSNLLVREIVSVKLAQMIDTVEKRNNNNLESYLMASYPRKYRSITSTADAPWMSSGKSSRQEQLKGSWQTKQHSNELTKYLQVLLGNDPKYGTLLLKTVLKSNK